MAIRFEGKGEGPRVLFFFYVFKKKNPSRGGKEESLIVREKSPGKVRGILGFCSRSNVRIYLGERAISRVGRGIDRYLGSARPDNARERAAECSPAGAKRQSNACKIMQITGCSFAVGFIAVGCYDAPEACNRLNPCARALTN